MEVDEQIEELKNGKTENISENSAMEAEEQIEEIKNGKTKGTRKDRAPPNSRTQSRLMKRSFLSLSKPSHTLVVGSVNIRPENRARLRRILSRLVRRHNWEEASGVLSVLLKGTGKERSPTNNRTKYWVAMELLKHIKSGPINKTKIQHVYDIWMKKIGSMKNSPVTDRFAVQLEFVLFCLRQGTVEDAHQAAICLMQQREFGSDPISNMVVGLTFCQLWYSTIPKEFQLRDSDESYTPVQSEISGIRFNTPVENSEGHDTVEMYEAKLSSQVDSETSVRNDKDIAQDFYVHHRRKAFMEVDDNPQREFPSPKYHSQDFYVYSAEDSGHNQSSPSNDGDKMQYTYCFNAQGLDSWLLPLRLLQSNESLEEFIYLHREMLNGYYKDAVKHLQFALHSTRPVYQALLPLVQMLLLENRIDEALNELEKFGHNSETALPLRAKARLLEQFDSANCIKLSTCLEDILKKDPTCSHSLNKLISMYQNGDYGPQQLLEMIALHLDAAYAGCNTWKQFASCFLKLYSCEEDRMSMYLHNSKDGVKQQRLSIHFNRIPKIFTDGLSGETWRFRCRWWLRRHFSQNILMSEIRAGDLKLLAFKAATASHMYGREFEYVVKAYACLEDKDRDLRLFLRMHRQNSVGFYFNFDRK